MTGCFQKVPEVHNIARAIPNFSADFLEDGKLPDFHDLGKDGSLAGVGRDCG
jgi:hypothetical protein